MKSRFFYSLSLSLPIFAYCLTSYAGGFQLWEQDASGIGDYHAGAAAEAQNPGTEYYNPAGMTRFQHWASSFGVSYIPITIHFTGTLPNLTDDIITAKSHTDNYVPNFHLIYPLNTHVALGFGVTVPYGLSTAYAPSTELAISATKTDLKTINLNPSLAVAFSKYLSIAIGLDALYGEATYDNDFSALSPEYFGPSAPLVNKLRDWGYGWNAGLLLTANSRVRFGFSYRSSIVLNGKGTSQYSELGFQNANNNLRGLINLPATTIMGFYADVSPRCALLLSAYYTQWNVFDNLLLENVVALGEPTTLLVRENYRNTWNFALGFHYRLFQSLLLKFGIGHDQTPTQVGYRDIRLPDASRYAVALGLHWQVHAGVGIDAGWLHFFANSSLVDNTQSTEGSMLEVGDVLGLAKTNANVFGVQINITPGLI